MAKTEEVYVAATYGCSECDDCWQGLSRAHCPSCHRTFNGVGLFDAHRRQRAGNVPENKPLGYCKDPATIIKKGARVMWETDGIWRSVETPAEKSVPPGRKPAVR